MKLLEYEAKQLLAHSHLRIPKGTLIAPKSVLPNCLPLVLKSQVPVGGRGKAGGVIIVTEPDTLVSSIKKLFKLSIKGFTPKTLLAEEKIDIARELYISLTLDQRRAAVRLTAHRNGGVDVEVNKDFFTTLITIETVDNCAAKLAMYFQSDSKSVRVFLGSLLQAFIKNDATLLEINPLIVTSEGKFVCGDCKMECDDAAAFRHPDWKFVDTPVNTNFVTLNERGEVATIANGAGLAMATVDAVTHHKLTPANFLDIGGGANEKTVLAAFEKIAAFPDVKVIVINIFAGITRCDEVARAIIAAKRYYPHLPSLCIRLAGTNFEEAVQLLTAENIPTLATLEECLEIAERQCYA